MRPVSTDSFAAIAAQRASALVRDVKKTLDEAPGPEPVRSHYTMTQELGGDKRQTDDVFRLRGGDHITRSRTTAGDGRILSRSVERYHHGRSEADERSDLVKMSARHIPQVVSRMCGLLGRIGISLAPQDSVLYRRQSDRWDGIDISSHRSFEEVRVYENGARYRCSDDNGTITVLLPTLPQQ